MLHAIIGYASDFDLAVIDSILHSSPAIKPCLLAAVRRMQEEQVNVAQSAFLD